MAQKVNVVLVDDIDGSTADETVTFGLDGATYEIDLTEANASALREALAAYVQAGRKVGGRRAKAVAAGGGNGQGKGVGLTKEEREAVRLWSRSKAAEKAGVDPLGDRGRIPEAVVEAWKASA